MPFTKGHRINLGKHWKISEKKRLKMKGKGRGRKLKHGEKCSCYRCKPAKKENHPLWKGGITELNEQKRKLCRICGELKETKGIRYCNKCRIKECPICKKRFLIKPKAGKIQKFCSRKCAGIDNSRNFNDEKKEILIKRNHLHRGEKSFNWRGGITPKHRLIRSSIENRFWVEGNLARDNRTCQRCKLKGGKLCVHHIQNFAQYPELRFAIDNGITLCRDCHRKFHKKYGIKNNNKKQIEKFLIIPT